MKETDIPKSKCKFSGGGYYTDEGYTRNCGLSSDHNPTPCNGLDDDKEMCPYWGAFYNRGTTLFA